MKDLFRVGILAAGLIFCLGCGGGAPAEVEAETQELYESDDYEQQMTGEMSGGNE